MTAFRTSCSSKVNRAAILGLLGIVAALGAGGCVTEPLPLAERPWDDVEDESVFDLPAHNFIHPGTTQSEVIRLVGPPREVRKGEGQGGLQEWYYDFGVVLLEAGEVKYKYPPSRAPRD